MNAEVIDSTHAEHGAAPADAHAEHAVADSAASHAGEKKDVFTGLIQELKNGQEYAFGPFGTLHLPYVFYDSDGMHFYANEHALEESHVYELKAGKPVRADNGHAPMLDMSISRAVVLMWVVGLLLVFMLARVAKKYKKSAVPKGFGNVIETLVVFIRDEVVVPTSGEVGRSLMPFFLTVFFFILMCNLLGLIPFGHTATGDVSVTAGLALISFVLTQAMHIRSNGIGGYLKHLTGGVHPLMWPIMVPVEFLGLFTKPFALCIRLFANMTAGHVVIMSLLGLIFFFKTALVSPLSVGFALFINVLELLVAFIQAYIFTMLTSLFIGMGLHQEHAHEEGAHH